MAPDLLRGKTMRLLVIDDDPTFCRYLAEVLHDHGHEPDWESDGLKAYERCLDEAYDVVVCDVKMPLILGTELANELRRDRPEQPIVLISAFADELLMAQAAERGMRLLSKPFDVGVLEDVLRDLAGSTSRPTSTAQCERSVHD